MADDSDPTERTMLAGDRTALANERTLGSWWRTAMSALALGLGFAKLFGDVEPQWLIRSGATLLVILGVAILWAGLRTYERTAKRIQTEHVISVSRYALWLGTGLLALVAAIAGAVVWMF